MLNHFDINTGLTPAIPAADPWTRMGRPRGARAAVDIAGRLRAMGCQILGGHAHTGDVWLRARLPAATDPVARARVLALRWGERVMIEWRG